MVLLQLVRQRIQVLRQLLALQEGLEVGEVDGGGLNGVDGLLQPTAWFGVAASKQLERALTLSSSFCLCSK